MTLFLKLSQDLYQTLKNYLHYTEDKNQWQFSFIYNNTYELEKGQIIKNDFCPLCTGSKTLNSQFFTL